MIDLAWKSQWSVSSTASRLNRLAAIPEGMMSGFFLTCLFGGCDNCSLCDFGGSGSGFEVAFVECDTAGGQGCQMAKFDPFLSLDCTRVEGLERNPWKGRNQILQRSVAEP